MSNVTRISPQEASAKLAEGWTYVDVRTTEEFEAGHVPGAVNVPIALAGPGGMVPNGDFVRVMSAAFPRDARLVVGCKSGGRSLRAAQVLIDAGYTSVVDQRAGWDGARNAFGQVTEPGWSRAGLPVEEGPSSGGSWDELKKKAP
ncbi:MAG TPA: rhodanese-like domain-containing protein [Polyangiaceae bacterium]|jgi:rhodanese-related sulfurtransferase